MFYFAYGHNTNDGEMHKRLPNALKIGTGTVKNYAFKVYRFANIEKGKGIVEGVLWKLTPDEMRILDTYENVPMDYRRRKVQVKMGEVMHTATAYVMRVPMKGKTSKKYVNWLKRGYRQNKISLPKTWKNI